MSLNQKSGVVSSAARLLMTIILVALPTIVLSQGIIYPPKKKPQRTTQQQPVKPSKPTTGSYDGHEWVDLGLSVKWATCNVGASTPEEAGDYFAWGETTTKSKYSDSNCSTHGKSMGDIAGDARYDAARANWGSPWRMPTKSEFEELIKQCYWTWASRGNKSGYQVTSRINGASIFLPAAGVYYETSLNYFGKTGFYGSSSPSGSVYAFYLNFGSSSRNLSDHIRSLGRTVRPVAE